MRTCMLLPLVLAGCTVRSATFTPGDPDGGGGDSSVDAVPAHTRAVVVATNFGGQPGVLSVLDLTTGTITRNVGPIGAVDDDPVIRKFGNELFIVNRGAGKNVTILDATTFALIEKLGTGDGSNPQDVAVANNALFIATLGNKGGLIIERGTTNVTPLDFSAADPDGKPDCNSVYLASNSVFFSCGLLDASFAPRGPGRIFVVGVSSHAVTQQFALATKNPIALFEQIPRNAAHGDELLMPTIEFSTGLGCVERIVASGIPSSAGCLIQNSALGAGTYAGRIAFAGTSALMTMQKFPVGAVAPLDLAAGTRGASLTPAAQYVTDVAVCPTGELVVADSSTTGGLRVYKNGVEVTTTPYDAGKPPKSSHGIVCY